MPVTREENYHLAMLLDGTVSSMKSLIPLNLQFSQAVKPAYDLRVEHGVMIGLAGDISGSLILSSDPSVLQIIGQSMFGMQLDKEMLNSFHNELGNMVAAGLSMNITAHGMNTDITIPSIIDQDSTLPEYGTARCFLVDFAGEGEMDVYLLLN